MTAQLLCPWCRNRSQEDILAEAQSLLDRGYYQTSRRHRMLARLPAGKTAHQALSAVILDEHWVNRLTEAYAGNTYLSLHAPEKDRETVRCPRVFEAFRALGGETYLAAWAISSRVANAAR